MVGDRNRPLDLLMERRIMMMMMMMMMMIIIIIIIIIIIMVKQSHYRHGQALRGSWRLRLPDFKTMGT